MSRFFRDFSRMSKVERFGTLYLAVIISIVALAILFFDPVYNYINPPVDYTQGFDSVLNRVESEYDVYLDSVERAKNSNSLRTVKDPPENLSPFYFDPNVLSRDSLVLLGFNKFVADNIDKYRKAGGSFYSSSDLKRIYNIDTLLIDTLSSFMVFPGKEKRDSVFRSEPEKSFAENYVGSDQKNTDQKKDKRNLYNRYVEIDLNDADTADLLKVSGIGPYYAANILKYRALLGGYVDVDQLREVYGISDSLYQSVALRFYIKDTFAPRKININEVSTYELSKHPYIKRHLAEMIVGHRYDKGKYKKTEDLIELRLITSVQHAKLKPYLKVK